MRRLLITLALIVAMVGQAAPALADEFGEYLDRAASAEYSGELFIICDTPDGNVAQFLEVTRAGGELWVRTAGSEAISANGELYQRAADGTIEATRIGSSAGWQLNAIYDAVEAGEGRELERPVHVVAVVEAEVERVKLHFDMATGALLRSEVRNGDSSLYCSSSFVSFSETPDSIDFSVKQAPAETVEDLDPNDIDDDVLPPELNRFRRLDVYEGPGESNVGYYSDGIFSFTVIASRRAVKIPELDDAPTVEIHGEKYRRLFQPGQVVYQWESRVGGYALVGDLPLDLQESALSDLPRPGRPGFFVRLWRSWFG